MSTVSTKPYDLMTSLAGLAELRAATKGNFEIRVAILDSAVDITHPSLAGADLVELDLHLGFGPEGGTEGARDHGTHVASLIFGQPGTAVTGIAPRCRGFIIPVLRPTQDGSGIRCNQLDLARAITTAAERGAHIINISGGELAPTAHMLLHLERAVRQCEKRNILVIAAAGNDGSAALHVPAAAPSVIAVGAEDAAGNPLAFSNWGAACAKNGLLAPGENLIGAVPGGGVVSRTGTSFATPVVSGIAALLVSLQLAAGRKPDPGAVRRALLKSATPYNPSGGGDCARALRGRLNVAGARALLFLDAEVGAGVRAAEAVQAPPVIPGGALRPRSVSGRDTNS